MRMIDADALMPKLEFILEAENQIYRRGSWGFVAKCINVIADAPTIEPEQDALQACEDKEQVSGQVVGKWIPCSERLPEDVPYGISHPKVIFCTENGGIGYGYYDNGAKVWVTEAGYFGSRVVAWQPLPEPYKGE